MTAPIIAKDLAQAARKAAKALAVVPGAAVHLGTEFSIDTLRELARLLGTKTKRCVYAAREPYHSEPWVIESLDDAEVSGVSVYAQGSDATRPGDDLTSALWSGNHAYIDVSGEAKAEGRRP